MQHESGCPPDRLAGWLEAAGARLEVCRPYRGDVVPDRVDAGALIVLGGHMGARDDDVAPWLPDVRALLARAVADGTPTLGVCLGAQLLALATRGRVEVGGNGIEAGVVDVRWRPEADDDELVSDLDAPFPGPSMHRDAVTELPPDSAWLGETDLYPHQVFRVGRCAWGVQFHPEVSVQTFREWRGRVAADDWVRYGVDGEAAVDQLRARDVEVADAGRRLAARFVQVAAKPRVTRGENGPPPPLDGGSRGAHGGVGPARGRARGTGV